MTLIQLKCFMEVAQYRNFTEAARHLNIVQSGVSYNIAELEKELNVRLFIRDRNNIELTYAGEQLLEKAFSIASLTRDISIIAKKVSVGSLGKLRIGYAFVPLIYRYKDLFSRFQDKYPNIDMKYGSYSALEIANQLGEKALDIGFTRYSLIPHNKTIKWKALYKDPLCAVVGKKHPLHLEETVHIRDLENDVLMLAGRHYDPGWYDLAIGACMNEQCTPEINDRTTDVYSVVMTVELGTGFTILPKCWKEALNNDIYFLDIKDGLSTETGIAWNRDTTNDSVPLFLKEFGISF